MTEPNDSIALSGEQVVKLRGILHDLSNVVTGVLVSGGLLKQALAGDSREIYAARLCEAGERGAALVRDARALCTTPEALLKSDTTVITTVM